ncbi:MAG: hypothetical protein NZ761_11135 [Dehalococcoidia bacterium]|nr:hypothetical protein [Dehalococcoidia bacterium]
MTKLVNLTPHPFVVHTASGPVTIPPSGRVVRATETVVAEEAIEAEIEGRVVAVPVRRVVLGAPEGLPEALDEGALYIVSAVARAAILAHRPELAERFVVGHEPVRDGEGRLVGVAALAR